MLSKISNITVEYDYHFDYDYYFDKRSYSRFLLTSPFILHRSITANVTVTSVSS